MKTDKWHLIRNKVEWELAWRDTGNLPGRPPHKYPFALLLIHDPGLGYHISTISATELKMLHDKIIHENPEPEFAEIETGEFEGELDSDPSANCDRNCAECKSFDKCENHSDCCHDDCLECEHNGDDCAGMTEDDQYQVYLRYECDHISCKECSYNERCKDANN